MSILRSIKSDTSICTMSIECPDKLERYHTMCHDKAIKVQTGMITHKEAIQAIRSVF